jgi:hypothetical protein
MHLTGWQRTGQSWSPPISLKQLPMLTGFLSCAKAGFSSRKLGNLKPKGILKHTFDILSQVIGQKNMQDPGNSQEDGEELKNHNREGEQLEEQVSD